jgi:CheY-like chemotaxis protein
VRNLRSAHLKSVLLVDCGDASRVATKWFLNNFSFEVHSARNGEEALALFDPHVHDLVITENSLPGMNGQELAHIIKLRSPFTPVIMYAEAAPENLGGLDQVILKPAHLLILQEAAAALIAVRRPQGNH